MKKIVFLILVCILSGRLMAQQYAYQPFDNNIAKDFTYGDYSRDEMDMAKYDKDTLAHAVVLKEYGKAWISSNGNNTPLTFIYHVKIKIFDSKAFNKGHVEIPFYIQDNGMYEEVRASSIQGVTYFLNDKGEKQESSLNPDSVHIVKENKHWSKVVFNLPNLHNGCIIEYKYSIESPFLEKFRTWEFQSDIPKVYSEYEVHIPTVFGYNVSLRGALKLTKDTVATEKDCFESTNLKSDCGVEDYEMSNIPAFKPEVYMTSPKNFLSALYFELTEATQLNNYTNLNQAWEQNVGKDWATVDNLLKINDNFGDQIGRRSIFKDRLAAITGGSTVELDKAKAIYTYIQKSISFNNLYSIYTDDGIKKALDKHSGNVAEINLALVTALNAAGIKADAVLVSTRDNGIPNKLYPALADFNYVIASATISGTNYLLDATDPLLSFGMLPFRSLNDQGREIPLDKPSYWINLTTPQKKRNVYTTDLVLADNGKLSGTITHYSIGYEAYEKREQIKEFKTVDDYIKSLTTNSPGITILKSSISNLDSLDMPLTEVYEVEIIPTNNNGELTFNPFIFDKLSANPFKPDTRAYPVNWGMPWANSYTLTLHLADNYTIDSPPQNITASLPNDGGDFTMYFSSDGNKITITNQYKFNKPVYSPAEYPYLKDLFDKIILSQKTGISITVKKKT